MASNDVKITGMDELENLFRELPNRVRKIGLRQSVSVASTPTLKVWRRLIPQESGLLRQSADRKIKTYRDTVVSIIGANTAVAGEYKGRRKVPAKYLHLVEQGHGGPHPAPPHPSLGPAQRDTQSQAVKLFAENIATYTEREAQKLGKK